MAIFVALIFQVLFVFFAMTINIGLVVHDKINLQNAVDLAAYYASQRQAEWLNVIAHQNYQIRQSYKLLSWRYRVLGTMGIIEGGQHPALADQAGEDVEDPISNPPLTCIAYGNNWLDIGSGNETICKSKFSANDDRVIVPLIKETTITNPFLPINFILRDMVKETNKAIFKTCGTYGGYNYLFTNLIKLIYRLDQFRLREIIKAEAANLARPVSEMVDLNGDSVYQGVQKTLTKNLTFENQNSLESLVVFNSIEGLRPDEWLNDVKVNIDMLYLDVQTGGTGCQALIKGSSIRPDRSEGIEALESALGGMPVEDIISMFLDPPTEDPRTMTVGVEKNPWVKLYMGVRAKTRPRQLFFPFGDPVQLEAVAYATPFGGRIGPWYKERWPQGANKSDGRKIDKLIVPSVEDAADTTDNVELKRVMPNYSRFPGDRLGLESSLAQSSLVGLKNFTSSISNFREAFDVEPGKVPDPLSWAGSLQGSSLRSFEMAAVAPDLFDISYYSIEPNYGETYLPKIRQNLAKLNIPQNAIPRLDLGGRDDEDDLRSFSIQDQMALVGARSVNLEGGLTPTPLHRPEAFYFIRDRAHLLTSWVHNDTMADFTEFPENRFGKCVQYDDTYSVKIPGACIYDGGRTGYSVKIISGQHLRSQDLQYGGANQRGGIKNPPPENW